MRSFIGRDILSLRDWERAEYFRIFEVADEMAPIARNRRNTDLLAGKTLFFFPVTDIHPGRVNNITFKKRYLVKVHIDLAGAALFF